MICMFTSIFFLSLQRTNIINTITNPSESLLKELQVVEVRSPCLCFSQLHAFVSSPSKIVTLLFYCSYCIYHPNKRKKQNSFLGQQYKRRHRSRGQLESSPQVQELVRSNPLLLGSDNLISQLEGKQPHLCYKGAGSLYQVFLIKKRVFGRGNSLVTVADHADYDGAGGVTNEFSFSPPIQQQSEVVKRVITMYLRCLAGDRPKSWLQWLPWTEFCYNSSYQTSLKCSPFQVVYGRPPPTLQSYYSGSAKVAAVDQQLIDRDVFLSEIRERLVQAQVTMKAYQDRTRQDVHFSVGDWVWLKLQQR